MYALALLARSAQERGDPARAGRLLGAVIAEDELGDVLPADDELTRLIAPLRSTSDPELARGIDLGKTASLEEAVALALTPP